MLDSTSNIAIYGFMGAGKTTLATSIARILGVIHIDLDEEISRQKKKSIPQIFSLYGEAGFRLFERETLENIVTTSQRHILSLGGGTLLADSNARLIQKMYRLFTLIVPFEIAHKRIQNSERPLRNSAQKIYTQREQHYLATGCSLHVQNKDPKEVEDLFWEVYHAS